MTPRRRAAALLGLALLLGVLAASDVAGREGALRRQLGPTVPVVVVRAPVAAGQRIARSALALRRVPARYAPAGAVADPDAAVGRRAAVAIAPGADLHPALLAVPAQPAASAGPALARGERALDVLALAEAEAVPAGTRVDVLVTDDAPGGATGATRMVLIGFRKSEPDGVGYALEGGALYNTSLLVAKPAFPWPDDGFVAEYMESCLRGLLVD